MTADARISPNFSRKLAHIHLFTIRLVQHCAAISATAELLLSSSPSTSTTTTTHDNWYYSIYMMIMASGAGNQREQSATS